MVFTTILWVYTLPILIPTHDNNITLYSLQARDCQNKTMVTWGNCFHKNRVFLIYHRQTMRLKLSVRSESVSVRQLLWHSSDVIFVVGLFHYESTLGGSERRKYCSKSCQSRASQGRIKARLAAPPSKRYAARLKFSSPLYFN